ncbi:MAG TPA: hypothetical protein VLM75_02680 [Spirochaetota bacterium]|nr:hypothetical protein [Spirochaetota bacterium]
MFCFASALLNCGSEFEILLDDDSSIYWTESDGDITVIRSNGTGMRTIVSLAPRVPLDVALDLHGKKLYWTEFTGSRYQIRRIGLNGDGEELYIDVPGSLNHGPTAIAIDPAGRKIYWNRYRSAPDRLEINRANLTIPATGQQGWWSIDDPARPYAYGISIDAINRKFYYTAGSYWNLYPLAFGSGSTGRVYAGELDAINSVVWPITDNGFTDPSIPFSGIAVDGSGGHIYYVNNTTAALSIRRADLNVNNRTDWVAASGFEMQKLALDLKERKIYWTSSGDNSIYRADLDRPNSGIERFLRLSNTPTGITVGP